MSPIPETTRNIDSRTHPHAHRAMHEIIKLIQKDKIIFQENNTYLVNLSGSRYQDLSIPTSTSIIFPTPLQGLFQKLSPNSSGNLLANQEILKTFQTDVSAQEKQGLVIISSGNTKLSIFVGEATDYSMPWKPIDVSHSRRGYSYEFPISLKRIIGGLMLLDKEQITKVTELGLLVGEMQSDGSIDKASLILPTRIQQLSYPRPLREELDNLHSLLDIESPPNPKALANIISNPWCQQNLTPLSLLSSKPGYLSPLKLS